MSVSSGSDITIPIQDSPPPPPSPYAGGGSGSKGGNKPSSSSDNVTIIDTTGVTGGDSGKKTPEPRGDVTVTVGFVNEAYQDHSPGDKKEKSNGTNNGAISIAVAGAAGKEKGSNGDTTAIHINEAVNPELINMNILNTIPDKPNPEYGPYDNMDEYFVPVNTHKKFLRRSEKLYVTKDKRKETRWKKYVCWLVGASVLATIVTVAVLAGIGLIPQKTPFSTEDAGSTVNSASSGSADISTSPENLIPSSTEMNTPPSVPADATYVPMAADINFHIKNLDYEPALNDKNSERFQELAAEIQEEVKIILKTKAGLETIYSRVSEFASGSVHVKMRIGWLDQSMDFNRVKLSLSNVATIGNYSIMPISAYEVVNHCKWNRNGCSHNCSYDYIAMDFYCFCIDATFYLAEDKKTCVSLYEISTSSTTSEIPPIIPELVSPSSDEMFPSSSPKPVDFHPETDMTPDDDEEVYPTSLPEDNVEPSPVPAESEEIATSPESIEPVSQEHHVPQEEIISLGSSTTSTTERPIEASGEPEHDFGVPIAAGESTTSTTTTTATPIESVNSSEEIIPENTEQPEGETTVYPVAGSHEDIGNDTLEHAVQESDEVDLGRTDISDENVRPTESVPEVEEHPESNKNSSESGEIVPIDHNESAETTMSSMEEHVEHDETEATTVGSGVHEEEIATVQPQEEHEQPHHITPMDVLSFNSSVRTSTTPIPLEPVNHSEHEQLEGRSVGQDSSVETVGEAGPQRSEALVEEEATTESSQMDDEASREPRIYSDEIRNSMQFLGENDEDFKKGKNREREEVAGQEQTTHHNATESASVETADENPGMASAVTSTSSEEGASKESVTQVASEGFSAPNPEERDEGSISGSGELSQESPVPSSGERDDSGERATFTPLSLHHDIDVNYVGNLTSDHTNTEHVNTDVENVDGVNEAVDTDKEKLVAVTEDSDEMMQATTAPVPVQAEVEKENQQAPVQPPQSAEQSESDIAPIPASPPQFEEHGQLAPIHATSSSETENNRGSNEDNSSGPSRGISPISESGSGESYETPNRDHRDTDEDLETFGSMSSSRSAESHEYGENFDKLLEELTTVPSIPEVPVVTTTASTTTSTTTTAATPEVTPEIITTTSTTEALTTTTASTTTPTPPVIQPEVGSTNSTLNSDERLHETGSLSLDHSNSHTVDSSHEVSASPEEPGPISSSSNEGAFSSGDNNSADDINNELT